jgi:hypothetical protein
MKSMDKTTSQVHSGDVEIARLAELIRSQNLTLRSQEIKIQALIQEVAYLRRMRYGVKSEAMNSVQQQLFGKRSINRVLFR